MLHGFAPFVAGWRETFFDEAVRVKDGACA